MKNSRPHKRNATSNRMYLVNLTDVVSRSSSLDDILNETHGLWQSLYDRMESNETLWVIAPNNYCNGQMLPVAMATADAAREESKLILKNTITLHTWDDRGADMESAYDEILFFVKNKREYQFDKDSIRVSHVYQGHEWGGEREKGNSAYHDKKVSRYNDNGKDPGNVWLEEDRTKTDNQEVDETGPLPLEEAVRRCVLAGSSQEETVYIVDNNDSFVDTIRAEDRVAELVDLSSLRGEVTN